MRLNDVYKITDALAPKRLSDEACEKYGYYDNSGVLVDCGEEIRGIVCSLDLSFAAIDKAIQTGANLIITHHPAIYGKIGDIRFDDESPLGKKLITCIKKGISVISMHLNLDFAPDGIDESLMDGILRSATKNDGAGTSLALVMHPLNGGGYGRVYEIPETQLGVLAQGMEKEFGTDRVLVYGQKEEKITKVASFCGAGADEESIAYAYRKGANVIVSSDFKHHLLALAQELGTSVIVLTHYASEGYGFKKYYEKIRRKIEIPCVYHTDENLL